MVDVFIKTFPFPSGSKRETHVVDVLSQRTSGGLELYLLLRKDRL